MRRLDDEMAAVRDKLLFTAGICTPKEKRDGLRTLVQKTDDIVGKCLPADGGVAIGDVCADGKRCV